MDGVPTDPARRICHRDDPLERRTRGRWRQLVAIGAAQHLVQWPIRTDVDPRSAAPRRCGPQL